MLKPSGTRFVYFLDHKIGDEWISGTLPFGSMTAAVDHAGSFVPAEFVCSEWFENGTGRLRSVSSDHVVIKQNIRKVAVIVSV